MVSSISIGILPERSSMKKRPSSSWLINPTTVLTSPTVPIRALISVTCPEALIRLKCYRCISILSMYGLTWGRVAQVIRSTTSVRNTIGSCLNNKQACNTNDLLYKWLGDCWYYPLMLQADYQMLSNILNPGDWAILLVIATTFHSWANVLSRS